MANQITGKILMIGQTQQIPSKDGSKMLLKRELVIDTTRYNPMTGERGYDNTPSLEFVNDRCAELDQYRIGQIVTISFDVQGTKYTDRSGVQKIFTSVRPYKIELKQIGQAHQPQAQQQAQQYAPQPQYAQQSPFPPQNPQYSQSPFPPDVNADGRPF